MNLTDHLHDREMTRRTVRAAAPWVLAVLYIACMVPLIGAAPPEPTADCAKPRQKIPQPNPWWVEPASDFEGWFYTHVALWMNKQGLI